jgi:hypothetical protein
MSDDAKCVCGHLMARHSFFEDHDECSECDGEEPCIQYRPAKNPPACPVDEQQCDAECQARPDRACATDPKSEESVYERARKALYEACDKGRIEMSIPVDEQRDHDCLIAAGLTAGEAAEKRIASVEERCGMRLECIETTLVAHRNTAQQDHDRAVEAEKRAEEAEKREEKWRWMVREAELRSIPNRIQQQNLLQEASGKYRKRAEAAERERDAELTRGRELEAIIVKLKDGLERAVNALGHLWAAIGDCLIAERPLAKGYGQAVARDVKLAREAALCALSRCEMGDPQPPDPPKEG